MKKTIQMEELVCPMCESQARNKYTYNASKAKVEFDETKTNVDELVKVITGLGYVVIG